MCQESHQHTHFNAYSTCTHRHRAAGVPYKNKLYHINHTSPLLFLSWPSLISSSTLSSLPCSVHLSRLSSIPLFPLIHPFNLAWACVGWSMCSSSDERMSSAFPANQNTAGASCFHHHLFHLFHLHITERGFVTLYNLSHVLSKCQLAKVHKWSSVLMCFHRPVLKDWNRFYICNYMQCVNTFNLNIIFR